MQFYENLDRTLKNMSTGTTFFTVKDTDGRVNTMAMSYGYVGFSWGRPYFIAFVGSTRYCHELLNHANDFTVSIPFDGKMKKELMFCGTRSGRDVDKAEAMNIKFIPSKEVQSPVVEGCDMYYECKVTYIDRIHAERLPNEVTAPLPSKEHDLVFGEIVKTYSCIQHC